MSSPFTGVLPNTSIVATSSFGFSSTVGFNPFAEEDDFLLSPLTPQLQLLDGKEADFPDLICCICTNLAWDATLTPCQHVFCKECISKVTILQCPYDRKPFSPSELHSLSTNTILSRMFGRLKVKCPFHPGPEKCTWTGEASEAFETHSKRCQYIRGVCQHCSQSMERNRFLWHWRICPQRPVECTFCAQPMKYSSLQCHYTECTGFVACPVAGCHSRYPRKDQDNHMKSIENMARHITLLAQELQSTKDELKALKDAASSGSTTSTALGSSSSSSFGTIISAASAIFGASPSLSSTSAVAASSTSSTPAAVFGGFASPPASSLFGSFGSVSSSTVVSSAATGAWGSSPALANTNSQTYPFSSPVASPAPAVNFGRLTSFSQESSSETHFGGVGALNAVSPGSSGFSSSGGFAALSHTGGFGSGSSTSATSSSLSFGESPFGGFGFGSETSSS